MTKKGDQTVVTWAIYGKNNRIGPAAEVKVHTTASAATQPVTD